MNNVFKSLFLALCIGSIATPISATSLDESIVNLVNHLFNVFKPTPTQDDYTVQLLESLQKDLDATLETRKSLLAMEMTTIHKGIPCITVQGKLRPLDKCWCPMVNTHAMLMHLLESKTKNRLTRSLHLTNSIKEVASSACNEMRKSIKTVVSQQEIDLYAKLVETTIECINASQPK